jgi:hypothetical protein
MNNGKKIVEKLISLGNNAEWAQRAVYDYLSYLNRVYGRITVNQAADIIRTIAE